MANLGRISDYATLRKKVRTTLLEGQSKIEQEKIRTYWLTGKLINDFILNLLHGVFTPGDSTLQLSDFLGGSSSKIIPFTFSTALCMIPDIVLNLLLTI